MHVYLERGKGRGERERVTESWREEEEAKDEEEPEKQEHPSFLAS